MERLYDLYQKLDEMRCRLAELKAELETLKTEGLEGNTASEHPEQPVDRSEDKI